MTQWGIDLKFWINANEGKNATDVNNILENEMKNIHSIVKQHTEGSAKGEEVLKYDP